MADIEKVIRSIKGCVNDGSYCNKCDYDGCVFTHGSCEKDLLADALELLKEQKEIKKQFIEAFNTIRDAYNAPANREKILLNYLARNACCCEQKLLR